MQRSSARLYPSIHIRNYGNSHIRGQTTLLACNRLRLPAYLWPSFLLAAFCIWSAGCSMESSMMQSVIVIATYADIGPSRRRLAQIKAHSAYYRLHVERELTEILHWQVIHLWRSQADASHVIVRHFFDWPSHITWKECEGQASTVAITEEHHREGYDSMMVRRESWAEFMLVSRLIRRELEEWLPSRQLRALSLE